MSKKEQQTVYIPTDDYSATHKIYSSDPLAPLMTKSRLAFKFTGYFFTHQELLDFIEKEVMAAFEAGAYWGVERYATTAGQLGFKIDTPDRSTYIESVKQKYK